MREKQGHFFGRRKGRPLNVGRLDTLDSGALIRAVQPDMHPQDLFDKPYKNFALEIGFGNGEHLVQQAERAPDTGFIGCEAFLNGVTACLAQMTTLNIRLWADDAMLLLPKLQAGTFDTIYLLFSDPWPKSRHHKRRVMQPQTVKLMARLLKKGGLLRTATDDANLAQWTLLHGCQNPDLHWVDFEKAEWRNAPLHWVETRYQQKAAQQGRQPHFIDFIKL